MELPIQVAVRIRPSIDAPEEIDRNPIKTIPESNPSPTTELSGKNKPIGGIVQIEHQSFPINHALPRTSTQSIVYQTLVLPLLPMFLEGFDVSIVTYGQRGMGKSYTLFGRGFECVFSELDQGLIQRSVRDIFAHLQLVSVRTFAINVNWVEISGNDIRDLLEAGSIQCNSTSEVFQWLQIGLANRQKEGECDTGAIHTLFTLTLEQQWISADNLIQHRLSTISFCDLCGTERIYVMNGCQQQVTVPTDVGLRTLERIVTHLTDPVMIYSNHIIPYTETTLTTLLKDSFGGRAQTVMILCISEDHKDIPETLDNLQFAFKTQCVRNLVVCNTFSDNNTPLPVGRAPTTSHPLIDFGGGIPAPNTQSFGLQFAATQWLKLVSNAEGLFNRLIANKSITDIDRERIEEWMFLKQECEECMSSGELTGPAVRHLGPIQETDEPEDCGDGERDGNGDGDDEDRSDNETSCQQNTDSEEDGHHPDLSDKVAGLMEEFRCKTDQLIHGSYQDYFRTHPKAVLDSNDGFPIQTTNKPDERRRSSGPERTDEPITDPQPVNGRRKSLQPGTALSSIELAMLNRVAKCEQKNPVEEFLESSTDMHPLRQAAKSNQIDGIQNKLRKVTTDLDARQRQIDEMQQTVTLKQKLIADLIKSSDTRTTAKQRFNKKKSKLEAEYEKAKKQLTKAVVNRRDKVEIERLKTLTSHIEQRLQDLTSIKHIASESSQRVKKLQQSVQETKKQLETLMKSTKKDRKFKESLESELIALKQKEAGNGETSKSNSKNLKDVSSRITHLDDVLKEKSENLQQYGDNSQGKESLRHEIRNLRRTRDHLLDQHCDLEKLKREKMLTIREERKLLECDEAIEAIDAAIEFKNELICGRRSVDMSDRIQREKGEQMLMARLNKLSAEEMRTLLYKYFQKVVDLRDSSRKLELQLLQLERDRDAWEWRERVLSNAVRQARLEGERHAVLLQRQQEAKLTLMLRHLTEETSASSSLVSGQQLHLLNDSDLDRPPNGLDMNLLPLPIDTTTKFKPLDKFKDKDRETKNKLFAKFQVLSRYHSGATTTGSDKRKVHDSSLEQNLKQLQAVPAQTVARVTREKNKIIIQQDGGTTGHRH